MNPQQNLYTKLWFIGINSSMPTDKSTSHLLDIEYDLYIEILKNHGAFSIGGEYWFDTKEQVEILTKELEPYYIFSQTN